METSLAFTTLLVKAQEMTKASEGPILRSEQLEASERELLLSSLWLREIIPGWYLLASPHTSIKDSTLWYALFWKFLAMYLRFHWKDSYCLSAESSLVLHTKDPLIPHQVVVMAPTGESFLQELPFQTSVQVYADPSGIPEQREALNNLQVMSLFDALHRVSPAYLEKSPQEGEIVLGLMQKASPYATRIFAVWRDFRPKVLEHFPQDPGPPQNDYLEKIQALYAPYLHPQGNQQRQCRATGCYAAFLEVKKSLSLILQNNNPGEVVKTDLQKWAEALFAPEIKAGLVPSQFAAYRKKSIYMENSRYIPPPQDAVTESMEALFECLKKEKSAAVRAILGLYVCIFIHPYEDGNGRIARLLMNTMLASGGYPWLLTKAKSREQYMKGLQNGRELGAIEPLVQFIRQEIQDSQPA